jgi:hypothetical protein
MAATQALDPAFAVSISRLDCRAVALAPASLPLPMNTTVDDA